MGSLYQTRWKNALIFKGLIEFTFFSLSDTRIGTADFYTPEKKRSGPYDNPKVQPNTISHYPSSSNGDFDKQYDEETEYSLIKTSNDNLACF